MAIFPSERLSLWARIHTRAAWASLFLFPEWDRAGPALKRFPVSTLM